SAAHQIDRGERRFRHETATRALPPAISTLQNRLSQRRKPKRSERGSPTLQILEALILPSQSCVPNSPTLSSTSIRRQYARQVPGSQRRFPCDRECTSSLRNFGLQCSSLILGVGTNSLWVHSSRTPCSGSMQAMRPRSPSTLCRVAYSRPRCG